MRNVPETGDTRQRITLDELDNEGCRHQLEDTHANILSATGLVIVRPDGDGWWRVVPNGKVGAVRIGNLQVQVTPKAGVGLTRLFFLLGYAADPGYLPEDAIATEEPDLWAAIAESLARSAEHATRQGVLQGYRSVEESSKVLRGRIRMNDQISRRPGFSTPLEVTYDEFTTDIAENQILRSAIRRMLIVPGLRASEAMRLSHIDARLADVTHLRWGQPLPAWRPSRLNASYQRALRLAEVVLRNTSTEAGEGQLEIAAFVVNMAKVFEDFVGTGLSEALRRYPGTTRLQYPDHLDDADEGQRPGIRLVPDVVHTLRGRPRLIFDAKYKLAGSSDNYPNVDHYQMLAYCTALQVPSAWLIYADGHRVGHQMRIRRIRNSTVKIVEYPLDLSAEPRVLLAQVRHLADAAATGGL